MSSFMLFFVLFSVFSYTSTVPVREKRFIPKININFEAGKTVPKPEQPRSEVNGTVTHTKVINAPFGLGALTITSSHSKPPGHGGCEEKPDEATKNEGQENNAPTAEKKPQSPISGLLGKIPFLNRKPHECKKENSASTTVKPVLVTDKSSTQLEFSKPTENIQTSTTENVDFLIDNIFGGGTNNGNGGAQTNLPNGSNGAQTDLNGSNGYPTNLPSENNGAQTIPNGNNGPQTDFNGSNGYPTNLPNGSNGAQTIPNGNNGSQTDLGSGSNGYQTNLPYSSTLRPPLDLNDRSQTGEGKIDQRISTN